MHMCSTFIKSPIVFLYTSILSVLGARYGIKGKIWYNKNIINFSSLEHTSIVPLGNKAYCLPV